jgi:multidrug efflux pump subunit AcrA (membrane-fusion protein)
VLDYGDSYLMTEGKKMLWIKLSTSLKSRLTSLRERQRPPIRRGVAFLLLTAPLGALFLLPGDARSQEVSYSVIPTYKEIRWDDAFGLERARLFGARASLDFGPFFSLQPFYAWKDDVGIRDGLPLPEEAESSESFDVKAFGADMQINLAQGSLVPFIRGGGGILRTEDELAGERNRIFLRGGGGVRIGLGGSAGLELSAERWTTRLEAPLVPGAVSEEDFPDDGIVSSTVFGAGVRIPFGGGSRETEGVSGILPGILLEPYAGRIDFADELRLEKQYLAGARAGVDLNQNVGLRAYYWKGVVDDFTEWMDLVGYGAEAQFALNTGSGLSPFLVAGVGRIDFDDEYEDLDGEPRTKENHLTLGGGASFWLGNNVQLQLGVRNLLMTVGTELEDVTDPDELVSNWQYSAGISFSFGARGRTAAQRATDRERTQLDVELERARTEAELERARLDAELEQARMDAELERARTEAELERARTEAELERLAEENRRLRAGEIPARMEREMIRGDTVFPGRTMVIPVPEVGEIILRYGEAYAVRTVLPEEGATLSDTLSARVHWELMEARLPEMVRAIVRDEMDRVVMAGGDTTQARLQRELLEARLPEMIRAIAREEASRAAVTVMDTAQVRLQRELVEVQLPTMIRQITREELGRADVQPTERPPVRVEVTQPGPRGESFLEDGRLHALIPFTGVQVSSPTQFLLGVRGDLGRIRGPIPLTLLPEFSLGLGEGETTVRVTALGRIGWNMGLGRNLTPYGQAGVSVTNRRFLSIDPAWGVTFDAFTTSARGPFNLFLEHRGVAFFKEHQLLVGVSLLR